MTTPPPRRRLGPLLVGLLGFTLAAVLAVCCGGGWLVARAFETPAKAGEVCQDPTASGDYGWCVQHRTSRFSDQEWVWIVRYEMGEQIPRHTYAPWPLNDSDFEVEFGADSITLSDPDGDVSVTYAEDYYQVD